MQRLLGILCMGAALTASIAARALIDVSGLKTPGSALHVEVVDGLVYIADSFEGCDGIRTVPDMDGDSLLDVEEETIGTHALRFDSDGDGFGDGEEVLVMGTDPLDPLDPTPAPPPGRRGIHNRRR